MNSKPIGLVLATAAAVLMSTPSFAQSATSAPADSAALVHCLGANACKGQGLCRTATSACKGMNSCKGQGWILLTADACTKAGGKALTE